MPVTTMALRCTNDLCSYIRLLAGVAWDWRELGENSRTTGRQEIVRPIGRPSGAPSPALLQDDGRTPMALPLNHAAEQSRLIAQQLYADIAAGLQSDHPNASPELVRYAALANVTGLRDAQYMGRWRALVAMVERCAS